MDVTRMRRYFTIGAMALLAALCGSSGALGFGWSADNAKSALDAAQKVAPTVKVAQMSPSRAISEIKRGHVRSAALIRNGQSTVLRITMTNGAVALASLDPSDVITPMAVQAAVDSNTPLSTTVLPAATTPLPTELTHPPFVWSTWLQEWGNMILMLLLVVLIAWTIWFMRGGKFSKKVEPASSSTKFDDVAGIDEIRDEVIEIADYLRDPGRFERMGATLPKGIVLYGPPGTGKTLLAKAVAGEAGVPFFSASGSEFVEVYVGVGARRIRDLFKAARKAAPSLLYIDEIDAIGERRSGGGGGGGEREHTATLDQLLSEMDGFDLDPNKPVVVLASTNRLEHLDPALVRSGRFDRKIAVGLPDREARTRILAVHMRTRPLSPRCELTQVAAFTAGMAGADLAALCNEAAFEATRAKRTQIELDDFRKALLRLAAGPEKRTQVISEPERRLVAYHEMGHAIVGHLLPNCEPVERVTVIPQGQALGVTVSIPEEDYFLATRQEHLDRLARIMGGRAAEELIFGEMTSGAADDLRKATEIARMMVEQLGMARATTEESLAVGLTGGSRGPEGEGRVEREIQEILASAYRAAHQLLSDHEALLHRSAKALLEAEALDRDEIELLLGPRPVFQRLVPRARTNPFPRFSAKRNQFAREFGEGVPEVTLAGEEAEQGA